MKLPAALLYVTRHNRVHRHVLSRSCERGRFILKPVGMEKWNWWSDNETASDKPKADGTYDVEGHTWGDVQIRHEMSWFSPMDWWIYISDIFYCLRKSYPVTWHFPKHVDFCPYTVSSFDVAKSDIAQEIAFERAGEPPDDGKDFMDHINDPDDKSPYRLWIKKVNEIEDEVRQRLTREDVLAYMHAKGMTPVTQGIWSQPGDYGTIYVDQHDHPFDMKDGWSDKKLCSLIMTTMHEMLDVDVDVNVVIHL